MRPLILLTGLVLCILGCEQPALDPPMTPAEREAIADTIRSLNQAVWDDANPITPEGFERYMSLWVGAPEDYFVGVPAVFVSMVGITSTPAEVRAIWEPIMGRRQAQVNTMVQDHVAVLSRDVALHVYKATFAIRNAEGVTSDPAPWTVSLLWVRTPEGWRILHFHQSWQAAETEG